MQPHYSKLTTKVTVGGIIFLVITAIAFALIAWNLIGINNAVNYLSSHVVEQAMDSGQFNSDVFRTMAEAESYGRARIASDRNEALEEIESAKETLEKLEQLANDQDRTLDFNYEAQIKLQQQRREVIQQLEPLVLNVLSAAEINNPERLTESLSQMNAFESTVEDIELASTALTESSVSSAEVAAAELAQRANILALGLFVLMCLMVIGSVMLIRNLIARPLGQLATVAQAVGAGDFSQEIAIENTSEIGQLQLAFRSMLANLRSTNGQLMEHQRTLEQRVDERTIELRKALDELQTTADARDQLISTVRGLSSPIMPVSNGVLAMPLVGLITEERAADILHTLLAAVQQRRAHSVILDVTGVPVIDTQVARTLIQAADAARMLGAQVALVGLRPELAQTIVSLGVDLSQIRTFSDLQTGIQSANHSQGRAHVSLQ